MEPRASLTLRWSRASVLALVVLSAGVVAHTSADGLLPGTTVLVLLLLALTAGCAALLGGRASALRLVAILVGGQAVVHTALAATAGHRGEPVTRAAPRPAAPVAPWDPRSGESYDAWAARTVTGGRPGQSGLEVPDWLSHAVADVTTHPGMALAHVLGAVAVGLWLAAGERALWALVDVAARGVDLLVDRFAALVVRAPAFLPVTAVDAPRSEYRHSRPPRPPTRSRLPVRRGPPRALLAC